MKLLATNPTLNGIKESIARYWYTVPELIEIKGEDVYQDGELMEGVAVLPHKGGFKFVRLN